MNQSVAVFRVYRWLEIDREYDIDFKLTNGTELIRVGACIPYTIE